MLHRQGAVNQFRHELCVPVRRCLGCPMGSALGCLAHHPAFRRRNGAGPAGRRGLCPRQDHGTEAGALAGRWLYRSHPQHAVPGADFPDLLRAAACGGDAELERGRAAGDGGECRRLCHRDRSRRHRKHQPRPDRSRPGAGPAAIAGVSLRGAVPRTGHGLSGAVQPVHPADAELQRCLDDLGAGTHRHGQRSAGAHLPQLRDLHRRHRNLPGAVDAVLRHVQCHSSRRVRAPA